MGKTPKEKHGNERRRPYNYPRNAQAQNSGTESRNYSYSTGNVPRRIPIYHNLQYQGIPGPVPNLPYHFGRGRGYRSRPRGINKPLKPLLSTQRRPGFRGKRVLSPLYGASARENMQSLTEGQETIQETNYETETTGEQVVKNGPEKCSPVEEELRDETKERMENGTPEVPDKNADTCEANGVNDDVSDTAEKVQPKSKSSSSKDKKSKKGSSSSTKVSPKGKHSSKQSPKSKKESKFEQEAEQEVSFTEKEKSHLEEVEQELSNRDSSTPEFQPSVKVVRISASQSEKSDSNNDSIIEITNEAPETGPSSSAEEITSKSVEIHSIKDSPRRSTRHSARQTPPQQKYPEKADSSSVIVIDSDDSVSVLEVSRASHDRSFAQSLRGLSGRPSLRALPAYNRSFVRPCPSGSASVRSNVSSRSVTTTINDSESDSHSRYGLWGLFRSTSRNNTSQESVTDNEEFTNRSVVDESGNDSEATTDPPFEAASNISFGKRKIQDADLLEAEQDKKRLKEDGEKNNANSSGLMSLMASPMNLFASKLKGDKGKSSTPLQFLKSSDVDDNACEDASIHQDDVSDIQFEEEGANMLEKDNIASKMDIETVTPRRWCSIM